jgi:hypothetical protein
MEDPSGGQDNEISTVAPDKWLWRRHHDPWISENDAGAF